MQHSARSYHRRQHWSGLNWFYSQVNGGLSQEKTPALLIKLDGNTYDTAPCRRQMDRWWNLRDTWQKVWQVFGKPRHTFHHVFEVGIMLRDQIWHCLAWTLAGNDGNCVCWLHPLNNRHLCLLLACRKCRPNMSATFSYVDEFFVCWRRVGKTCCRHTLLHERRNQF